MMVHSIANRLAIALILLFGLSLAGPGIAAGDRQAEGAEPEIVEVVSPGGIRAWLRQESSIQLLALDFRFEGGAALLPAEKAGAADETGLTDIVPAMLRPPLPPPPPIDCAAMPGDCMPSVVIAPLLVTNAPLALPPVPPVPPMPMAAVALAVGVKFTEPETAKPPLPPLPPTDWARMPVERSPAVLTVPPDDTVTLAPVLPDPPLPPTAPESGVVTSTVTSPGIHTSRSRRSSSTARSSTPAASSRS